MNYLSTKLPAKSWNFYDQVLYNIMYEEGALYSVSAPGIYGIQYPGKPLWLHVDDDLNAEELRVFFGGLKKGLTGIVTAKWPAKVCAEVFPNIKNVKELAAFYLPSSINHKPKGRLVFPISGDIPMLTDWILDFYAAALGVELKEAQTTARVLVEGKRLYCLEVEGNIVAMGMLIPLANGMCRLNLIYTPYKGQGYGKDVTAAISAKAQEWAQIPVLYANVDNKVATGIYASLGFMEVGRLVELQM